MSASGEPILYTAETGQEFIIFFNLGVAKYLRWVYIMTVAGNTPWGFIKGA